MENELKRGFGQSTLEFRKRNNGLAIEGLSLISSSRTKHHERPHSIPCSIHSLVAFGTDVIRTLQPCNRGARLTRLNTCWKPVVIPCTVQYVKFHIYLPVQCFSINSVTLIVLMSGKCAFNASFSSMSTSPAAIAAPIPANIPISMSVASNSGVL